MPFDPAPREVKVGEFQDVADAILRGCAASSGQCFHKLADGTRTCAVGALAVGWGLDIHETSVWHGHDREFERFAKAHAAYEKRYGAAIASDNDSGNFTREQIAARIAAL